MKRIFTIILFLLCSSNIWADATPKFNEQPELEFWKDGKIVSEFDSLLVTSYLLNSDSVELLYPSLNRSEFNQNVLNHNGTNYKIDERTALEKIEIMIIHEGNEYNSSLISLSGDKSFLRFELNKSGEIKSNMTLLYCKWEVYFNSLFITILLELIIILVMLGRNKKLIPQLIISIIVINLLTHFSLWYVDSRVDFSIVLLEIMVFLIEAILISLLFKSKMPFKRIILAIFLANLCSWWLGSLVHWMIR